MRKSLIVLAILSTMSAPALAQNATATDSSQQPVKPQTVKKRVCETIDENPYSRLGNRKICRTIEVPVQNGGDQAGQSQPSADPKGK